MKRSITTAILIACASASGFASTETSQSTYSNQTPALIQAAPAVVDCPEDVLKEGTIAASRIYSTSILDVKGTIVTYSLVQLDSGDRVCAVMVQPELRALSAWEHEAMVDLALSHTETELAQHRLADRDDVAPNAGDLGKAAKLNDVEQCTSRKSRVATVYAGQCGSSDTPIASAYFATSHLALTAGSAIPADNNVCVRYFNDYFDVHEVRRTEGTGASQLAGLSLVPSAGYGDGFRALNGNLIGASGAVYRLQVDGEFESGYVARPCQSGAISSYTSEFARFLGSRGESIFPPTVLRIGGTGWEAAASGVAPLGVHTQNILSSYPSSTGLSTVSEIYPVIRRNRDADIAVLTAWSNTAAPPANLAITITNPVGGQLIDNQFPTYVTVDSQSAYALQLDGQPLSSPMNNLAAGWHTLVAYNPAQPKYRHTVRFEAKQLTLPPDAYESDDTRETYKALYSGLPQTHNFHNYLDVDWAAFAVGERVTVKVTLAGVVARDANLRLYRQLNYPTGPIEQVASQSNKANQLVVSNNSSTTGMTVYYVESRSSWTGPGSQYTLSVDVDQLADGYEPDNTRETYTALYEGVPQTHNFHTVSDQDWVAFAVLPGVTSQVQLQGAAAAASRLDLYRQLDYPNGTVELVSSDMTASGTLSVQHTGETDQAFIVYYVRAMPNAANPAAIKKNFTLSVSVSD